MKNIYLYLVTGTLAMSLFACKKSSDEVSSTSNTPPPAGAYIKTNHLKGTLKGSMKQDSTYYLDGNVVVNAGDSLGVSPGATIIATGNYNIEIGGTLICNGTDAKQITFTTNDPHAYDSLGHRGSWGGILIDSTSKYVSVTFTHINYTGGADASGSFQASFDVEGSQSYNGGAKIIFEDNWMFGGMDDAIHLAGNITCSVKRNVLQRLGGPDGDLINIKKGAHGVVAYNYIWSSANSSIKLNTGKTVLSPQTKFNIYNNTMINGSWRKVDELSSAILIDQFSAANIYNNIIVACRNGINITVKADTLNCKYGNNLIYTDSGTVDAFTNNAYIPLSFGKPQSTDKIASGLTACGTVFTNWDDDVTVDKVDNNVPTLKSGSPAIGNGTTSATLTSYSVGSVMTLNKDMGAYPTDGSGNKHMPTKKPAK